MARVGDKATCPRKGHGGIVTIVASSDPTIIIDGQPAAFHGDPLSCGCSLIARQFLAFSDPKTSVSAVLTSTASAATAAQDSPVSTSLQHEDCEYDQHVILIDQDGNPLDGIPYRLLDAQGATIDGISDADGKTKIVGGHQGDSLDCEIAKETEA